MTRNAGPRVMAATMLLLMQAAGAMECPTPEPAGRPGVIPESAVEIEDLSALLESGDRANRIEVLVHGLKQAYPTAGNAAVVNYLVSAFCPVVNQLNGLGDAEKQARMDAFTRQLFAVVH